MTNKLNTHFNSIGNNALKNAETSVGIIEELTLQNSKGNLKVKGNSIYTLLGVKNGQGIISQLKSYKSLNELTTERKKVVNKLILPKAELNHLIEEEKTSTPKTTTTKQTNYTNAHNSLCYLLTRMELDFHKYYKHPFSYERVSYQRSRGHSTTIRLQNTVRVFLFLFYKKIINVRKYINFTKKNIENSRCL